MAVKRDTAEPQRISAMEERGNRRAGERPQIVLCSGRAPRLGPQRTRGQAAPGHSPKTRHPYPRPHRQAGAQDSEAGQGAQRPQRSAVSCRSAGPMPRLRPLRVSAACDLARPRPGRPAALPRSARWLQR